MGQARPVADSTANQALQAYRLRDTQAELAAARWLAAQERAARAAKKAAAARAAQAAAQAAAQSSASQSAQTAPAAAAPAPSGSPQQVAEAMLGSFGWSSSQFSCLDPLWQRESGWSVTAANPDGAYGIPQALPGAKMASAGPDWQNDAATQIRWGLEYIKSLYGSPCGAWDHELATGWY
jgi:nucleoid-associated protein YgaU